MSRKTKVKPVPKVAAPESIQALGDTVTVAAPESIQALGDTVTVAVDPATHKKKGPGYVSNLPRDPVTGKPLPPPKRKPVEAKSLQDAAHSAFQALGGEAWLRKQGREFPKEFMSLLVRTVGEEGVSGGMQYIAIPIPVEQRELPGGALESIPQPVADEPDFLE